MNSLTLILRNLFRRKLRASLMMVSIFVAFAIFGVLAAFERAFYAGGDLAASNRLVVVNKINFTQPLPIAYVNRVRGVDGVRDITHANWFGGYYQDPKNFMVVMAVEPASYLEVFQSDFEVTAETRAAFVGERTGALVGEAMARKWGWKIGDHVPIQSNIFSQKNGSHTWEVTIVGTVGAKNRRVDTNFMLLQYAYFDETRSFGRDTIGWIVLNTVSPDANDRVAKAIDALFQNSLDETATDTEKAFNKAFVAQLGNIALIVLLVVGAAFITILMVVGNTMALSVRERTREIGVLKTLGFSQPRILALVLGESVLLAILGGIPGMALAQAAAFGMQDSIANFVPGLTVTPDIYGMALLLMLGLGLATGLLPALGAMRLDIVTALGRS